MKKYHFISAASGWGAQIRNCQDGPDVLRTTWGKEEEWETLYPKARFQERDLSLKEALPLIVEINSRLADCVCEALKQNHFPLIVGGDHSLGIGTWNGVALSGKEPLGLIWIDAHMDAHTPQTTPSGAWHGMPLAALLGYGTKELTEIKRIPPILQPENICLIGVRSFEEGEQKLLEKLGVRIYFIEEVKKIGFEEALKEAVRHVTQNTAYFGVSLDIDVVDPTEAPGVGSPEPNGISAQDLLEGLKILPSNPHLAAFELVEFNPDRDRENKTLKLCSKVLSTLVNEYI